MEGLTGFGIAAGMVVGFAVLFWAVYRFNIKSEVFSLAKMGAQMAELVVKMLFPNDVEKQKALLKPIQLLIVGINNVEVSKRTIDSTLPPDATDVQRHAAYTAEAIRIAETLGKEQGIVIDGATKMILEMAAKFILGWFRGNGGHGSPQSGELVAGLYALKQDSDGIFRPMEP